MKIASWTVCDVWGKIVCRMPYNSKDAADQLAAAHGFFVTLSKEPIERFVAELVWVHRYNNQISYESVYNGLVVKETIIVGRLIMKDGEIIDDLEHYAKNRWPTTYAKLMLWV